MITHIKKYVSCVVVKFDNGVEICSHTEDEITNWQDKASWRDAQRLAPNLRVTSDLDLNECLVAYWIDKHHKQWFFTRQDEEFVREAAELFPDRIYFILVPASI